MSHELILVETADGSRTLFHPLIGEHYHSRHGALQEAEHVFLKEGFIHYLDLHNQKEAAILEVGFGTGLNFLVTADHALKKGIGLTYTGLELFPLKPELIAKTGYGNYTDPLLWKIFLDRYSDLLHAPQSFSGMHIQAEIVPGHLLEYRSAKKFDLIYFDAFSPIHQPEMWTEQSIRHITAFLKTGGIFITYSITGQLKRILKNLNFAVEKPKGAPGKREMLRARKQ